MEKIAWLFPRINLTVFCKKCLAEVISDVGDCPKGMCILMGFSGWTLPWLSSRSRHSAGLCPERAFPVEITLGQVHGVRLGNCEILIP